jgi:cell division protein FtsI/penicillin-binding protein 2
MVITKGTAEKSFRGFKSDKCVVYGKTGTAQKGKRGLYDGWFVSFTKGLDEDIVVATVIKNSGTGATYSAPINRKIIEAWIKKEEKER